ncbi:hypothetical protein GOBAR_AA22255 [Gossypium barbadense]|uniref:Uncharacterized protein n=1 Tax=Gossypium barbadense TaxID=3634 RepID=A0A2P5X505_GOSBA|nr:hypothetical protein GOBAR_AA22255 [Gossypium barbadense]
MEIAGHWASSLAFPLLFFLSSSLLLALLFGSWGSPFHSSTFFYCLRIGIWVVVDTDLSLLFVRDGASRDGAGVGQSSNSCHGMVH